MIALWIVLLVLVLTVAIVVAAVVLPKKYLKTRYTLTKTRDRGIKAVEETNGRTIVYEPAMEYRKYIKQYLLSERGDKKQLACKLGDDISYLAYDVAVFNNRDELVTVLTVKEKVEDMGITSPVDLPASTSYVGLTVTAVDAEKLPVPMTAKVKAKHALAFLFWSTLCVVVETLCVKVCFANIFGGVFRELIIMDGVSALVTAGMLVGVCLVNVLVCLIAILIRGRKKVWTE